jgi:pimeloyl-ACP methyl ester carboxylesterase
MEKASRSNGNGRTCFKERTRFSHLLHLVPRTSTLDPKLLAGEFAVPVFVIQGAEDGTTPTSLTKTYVNSLHAPRKAFVTIDRAGHFAVFTKQDVFLKELRARVLPLIH